MPIIDDTNSALVYSGSWTYTPGPSEQEGGAVRSTTQVGASVRLRFRGTLYNMSAASRNLLSRHSGQTLRHGQGKRWTG